MPRAFAGLHISGAVLDHYLEAGERSTLPVAVQYDGHADLKKLRGSSSAHDRYVNIVRRDREIELLARLVQAPQDCPLDAKITIAELGFLRDYANDTSNDILKDKRFKNLLKQAIPHTEYHYGTDKSLQDASEELLRTNATYK